VLTELSSPKGSIEILQKEVKENKSRVVDGTDRAVNTYYETNISIEVPLK
jgi:hypothetical protein